MSFEKLTALGAESVAGTVYLNKVEVARFGAEGCVLNEAGEAALAEAATPVKASRKKAEPPVTEVPVVEVPPIDPDPLAELNNL